MQPKFILLSCIFLISMGSKAQFRKGSKLIGTTIGSSFISSGETKYSYPNNSQNYTAKQNNFNLNISPSIGWFFKDNLVGGAQLITIMSNQKTWLESESNGNTYKKDEYRNTDFGAGVFLRYYFTTAGGIKPFAHAFLNAGSGVTNTNGFYLFSATSSQTYTGKSSERFFYNAGINAGITKMISGSVGLEGFVGFSHSKNKFTTFTRATNVTGSTTTTSEYDVTQNYNGNGVNVGLGLVVVLGK